jgi:hypothetical protein
MAKDVERDDDDGVKPETMSEESLNFLEQVRKGKARNFVMSVKGAKVRSLIIKKKKVKDKDKKECRGQGYQPVFGVASGMGANVTFTVAKSDGFAEAPGRGKVEKLKKFLKEQTDKAFKPQWEVVDTPPPIPFDEEDLSDPLIAKFMKLEPVINKVCDEQPDRVGEVTEQASEIRELLQDEETRSSAGAKIDAFVQFLKQLLAGPAPSSPKPPGPPTEDSKTEQAKSDDVVRQKLHLALAKLAPVIKQAIQNHPQRRQEILEAVAAAKQPLDREQLAEAKQGLIALSALAKELATPKTPPPAQKEPVSLVVLQKSRLAWDAVRKRVQTELQELERSIVSAVQEHNAAEDAEDEYDESELAAGTKQLYTILDRLDERLIDKLDEALNAEDPQVRQARHGEAVTIIQEYQAFVDTDPLLAAIDENGFTSSTIRKSITTTLGTLASKL